MKSAVILLASLAVAGVAGVAAAGTSHMTDVDYLKANRCRGLAEGLGGDTASLDTLIKAESRNRVDAIYERGKEEATRGKRDAGNREAKERFSAELNGPCMAYIGGANGSASAAKDASSTR